MNKRPVILLAACCSLISNAYALPEVIDNSAYPPSAIPSANIAASPSTSTMMEMTGRMDQLQTEVQQLTGKVEEQANTIMDLKKQQKAMYADFEDRLQSIEGKNANSTPSSSETVTDTSTPPAAEAEAQPAPDSPAAAVAAAEAGTATAASAPAVAPAPSAPVPEGENQEYKNAYMALRKGHTDESITAFKEFLGKYPSSGLANNAQYWLGEAYLVNKDTEAARQAFTNVVDNYPGSTKEPDALLMLGKIAMDQKNSDKARDYFTQVTTKYPNTTAARTASKKLPLLNGNPLQ